MDKYFFTFGTSEKFPYQGGWVEVHALSLKDAVEKFKASYPNRNKGIVNCADCYDENSFIAQGFLETGNLGAGCHTVIE